MSSLGLLRSSVGLFSDYRRECISGRDPGTGELDSSRFRDHWGQFLITGTQNIDQTPETPEQLSAGFEWFYFPPDLLTFITSSACVSGLFLAAQVDVLLLLNAVDWKHTLLTMTNAPTEKLNSGFLYPCTTKLTQFLRITQKIRNNIYLEFHLKMNRKSRKSEYHSEINRKQINKINGKTLYLFIWHFTPRRLFWGELRFAL